MLIPFLFFQQRPCSDLFHQFVPAFPRNCQLCINSHQNRMQVWRVFRDCVVRELRREYSAYVLRQTYNTEYDYSPNLPLQRYATCYTQRHQSDILRMRSHFLSCRGRADEALRGRDRGTEWVRHDPLHGFGLFQDSRMKMPQNRLP